MVPAALAFPPDFRWGVGTAAAQVEGAIADDGREASMWDKFSARSGHPALTATIAADHYHRWQEDVGLIAALGVGVYRLSVAWPRVQPEGRGRINSMGLAFYDRLVDGLLDAGIEPLITLYHWDLPQAMEDRGGWMRRSTAEAFADYAGVLAAALGDRVTRWITINEPFTTFARGYGLGTYAPGRQLMTGALWTVHWQLLAHGLAVQALRAAAPRPLSIGIANHHAPAWAATDDPRDEAAVEAYERFHNWMCADPVLLGRYPDQVEAFEVQLPTTLADDLAIMGQPLEFYGVNYTAPVGVRAPADEFGPLPFDLAPIPDRAKTMLDTTIAPEGLTGVLSALLARYGPALPPILVTECGYPDVAAPTVDGSLDDRARITFHEDHLRALHAALEAGVDVRGYVVRSLLDGFEWGEPGDPRFGLIHVDFETQRRTPKASYHWYRDVIRGVAGGSVPA